MLNKWRGIGRLTADPEQRFTQNGIPVTKFTLAVEDSFKNQDGNKNVSFIPIIAWRGLAETCAKYLAKGRMVAVSGRIQTRSYDGQDGGKRYITEIVADEVQFLSYKDGQAQGEGSSSTPGFTEIADNDDELPF